MRTRLLVAILVVTVAPAWGDAQVRTSLRTLGGRVVAAGTGEGLLHARVDLRIDGQAVSSTLTSADGRFALPAPDRAPTLQVTKAGYLAATLVAAGGNTTVSLVKAGAISGRLIDETGQPLSDVTVTAERSTLDGSARSEAATCQTDDRGEYRLRGLGAGQFLIHLEQKVRFVRDDGSFLTGDTLAALRGGVRPGARQRFESSTYYPGVRAVSDAQIIALAAGEERTDIDMAVRALAPLHTPGTDQLMTAIVTAGDHGAADQRVAPSGIAAIRGRVLTADGSPLPQAIVHLQPIGRDDLIRPALTDAEGRYEFRGVRAGSYAVVATGAGFLTLAYGQRGPGDLREPVGVEAGQLRAMVDIALPRRSAVAGRVVDEVGEPVENAEVHVWQVRFRRGQRQLVDAGGHGTHRTDDRGVYRIYGVLPGRYIVSASLGRGIVPGELPAAPELAGYVTTYYPTTDDPGAAQRVEVDVGREVSNVDLALVRTRTVQVAGVALDASGHPLTSEQTVRRGDLILPDDLLLAPRRPAGAVVGEPVRAHVAANGRFQFRNVTPGEYVVQGLRVYEPSDEGEFVSQPLTVGNTDISDLTIRMARGSTLAGRLTLDSDAPADLSSVAELEAVPLDMDRTPRDLEYPGVADIHPDGTFEIAGLSGPRVLRLGTNGPSAWTLKAVRLDGRDVTDTPLVLGRRDQSIDQLEVVLTSRSTDVTGHVVDARGRGAVDATVVVFAADRRLWGTASRFLGFATSGRDGAFAVRRLPPGDYYAAATLDPGRDVRDPGLLEALVPGASRVIVAEGEHADVEVQLR